MKEEGYIKFRCLRENSPCGIPKKVLMDINAVRTLLKENHWLGVEQGVGYGNLSLRLHEGEGFYISGSGSGELDLLTEADIALVMRVDIFSNRVECRGLRDASSESLTHAAIYQSFVGARAVIHIHDSVLWQQAPERFLSTAEEADYGSIRMAASVALLSTQAGDCQLLRMGGHRGGFISWGKSLPQVFDFLCSMLRR